MGVDEGWLKWASLTSEERRNEVGTEGPCPFCQRPRLRRSDYVRCTPCATNWLDDERHLTWEDEKGKEWGYMEVDPSLPRAAEAKRRYAASGVTMNLGKRGSAGK